MKVLTKTIERKVRPIINKKYPGADFPIKDQFDDGFNLAELYDPPDNMSLDDRIAEMEEHLTILIKEELSLIHI